MTVLSPSSFSLFLSLSACLASSRPLQAWLSSILCLPQKRFWQKPQSPTIGWAAALHGGCAQRGLFDFLAGVEVLDVLVDVATGVEAPDIAADVPVCAGSSTDGRVAVMSVGLTVEGSVGAVPP